MGILLGDRGLGKVVALRQRDADEVVAPNSGRQPPGRAPAADQGIMAAGADGRFEGAVVSAYR